MFQSEVPEEEYTVCVEVIFRSSFTKTSAIRAMTQVVRIIHVKTAPGKADC